MSATVEGPGFSARAETLRLGEDDDAGGWMLFAGVLLLILACTNIIGGIAAVNGSHFFALTAHYVFGDLNSWGWVVWLVGLAQGLSALGVLVRNQLARWLGLFFASLNALAQLLILPAAPFWSLPLFAADLVAIYGLTVHGGRRYRPA